MLSNIIQEISKVIIFILSLPKTLLFNFYYLPFHQAIKLPIFIPYNIKLREMKGNITIDQCKIGIIQIGFNSFSSIVGNGESFWCSTADIHFHGKVRIGCNPKLRLTGKVTFGHNFEAGHNFLLMAHKEVYFDEQVLLSWNVTIMDADGHRIFDANDYETNPPRAIHIGKHTWVGCHSTILKGTILPANSIIASHTLTTKSFSQESCVIAGSPGRVVRTNLRWQ